MLARKSPLCWGARPSTVAPPVVGVLSPARILSKVVFPAPLGPTSALTRPRGTDTDTDTEQSFSAQKEPVPLAQAGRLDGGGVLGGHAILSIGKLDSVARSMDSMASSSSPSPRAVRTQLSRLRASRSCVPGGGPAGRRATNVPTP